MEQITKLKLIIAGVGTFLVAKLGALYYPFILLLFFCTTDYVTGVWAAKFRNQKVNSNIGFRGLIKKTTMLVLVAVGAVFDFLLVVTAELVGVSIPLAFPVSIIIAIWLAINESISILENIGDILGDRMPKWLLPIFKHFHSKIEDTIDIGEKEE